MPFCFGVAPVLFSVLSAPPAYHRRMMKHAERVVVYTALAASLALGLGFSGFGGTALASRSAANPTVSVEPKPVRLATIDLGSLIFDQFMLNEAYKAARTVEEAKVKPLQDLLLGMKTRLEKMDQNAPEFKAEVPAYQAKVQELQQAENAFSAFTAQQVAQATREIAAATKTVADANGYTHVVVSRPLDAAFRGQNPDAVLAEALQRTILVSESGTDITALVRKELKIPEPLTVTPLTPPDAQPAPTTPSTPAAPK
jgi:Skp family chaperone for outer membrane proteins